MGGDGVWLAGKHIALSLNNAKAQCKYQQVEAEKPGRQAAVDLYELKVSSRVMAAWVEFSKEEKRRQYGHVMKAIVFHRRQESPVTLLSKFK